MAVNDTSLILLDIIRRQSGATNWNPNRAYLIADAAGESEVGLVSRAPSRSIDVKTMSVEGIVSSSIRSADGDILESAGVDMSAFRPTPTFDLIHQMDKPLGVAEDPDGQFTMRLEGDLIVSRSYFAQSSPLAVQYFALVNEGVIRGLSIRARPDWSVAEAQYEPPAKPGEQQRFLGFHFPKSRLINYAFVPIPDNKDCVTRALGKRFDGKFLHEDIVRAIKPWAAVSVPWSNGWTPDATTPEIQRMSANCNTPAVPASTVARAEEEKPTPRPDKSHEDEETEREIPEMTPGAKAGLEVHRAMTVCREMIEASHSTHDHPEMKELHRSHQEKIDSMLEEQRAAMEKHFPEVEFDFEEEKDDEGNDKTEKDKEESDRAIVKLVGKTRHEFHRRVIVRTYSATKKLLKELVGIRPTLERIAKEQRKNNELMRRHAG